MLKQSWDLFKISWKHCKKTKKDFIISLVLTLFSIAGIYYLNTVYGRLYEAIQQYNANEIWLSVGIFAGVAFVLVLIEAYSSLFLNRLAFNIRSGLTDYYVASLPKLVDNIEQRVQEDLRKFGEYSVSFWFTILRAGIKIPLFMSVIGSLTHWWIGVILAAAIVGGTILTKVVARKLILLQAVQEGNEADLRKSVFTSNVYAVYAKVEEQFHKINTQLKKLSLVQNGLGQGFVLLPFILLLPLYISKVMTMGAFFQSIHALDKVISSLTVLIDNRQLIANISSTLERMKSIK